MTTKTTILAPLLALLGALTACSGGTDEPGTPPPGSEGAPSTGGSGDGSEAEYTVSCQGDVTKANVGLGSSDRTIRPRCIGGEPGKNCASDPCEAQDIVVSYVPPAFRCGVTTVFAWDGQACKGYPTGTAEGAMHCKGVDCEKLYKNEAECQAAFAECASK